MFVLQALLELEMNSDLKAQLRELYIAGAKEIDVQGKKAIIIFVPVPQLRAYQKIQTRLVRELEKKFSGKHVVFIAQRRILPKPTRKTRRKNKQKRPRRYWTHLYWLILWYHIFAEKKIVGILQNKNFNKINHENDVRMTTHKRYTQRKEKKRKKWKGSY